MTPNPEARMGQEQQTVTPVQAVSYFQMQLNQLQNLTLEKYLSKPTEESFVEVRDCLNTAIVCVNQLLRQGLTVCSGGDDCGAFEHCEDGKCVFGPPDRDALSAGPSRPEG